MAIAYLFVKYTLIAPNNITTPHKGISRILYDKI
jgi:hypothetical protein